MNFTKILSVLVPACALTVFLMAAPESAYAQERPSGTGKTMSAVMLASGDDVDDESADDMVGEEQPDDAEDQTATSKPEWRYVPIRRTN